MSNPATIAAVCWLAVALALAPTTAAASLEPVQADPLYELVTDDDRCVSVSIDLKNPPGTIHQDCFPPPEINHTETGWGFTMDLRVADDRVARG